MNLIIFCYLSNLCKLCSLCNLCSTIFAKHLPISKN